MKLCSRFAIAGVVIASTLAGSAMAGNKFIGKGLAAATQVCGGNHRDNVTNNTNYVLRNYNNDTVILLDRFVVRDANGVVVFDYPNMDPLPSNIKTQLGGRQSTIIKTTDILSGRVAARPIMTDISWHSADNSNVLPMGLAAVRITSEGRHTANCRYLATQRAD